MKPVSGPRMIQILQARGWYVARIGKSSHYFMVHPGPPRQTTTIPVHGNHDLATGTQKDIMKQAGLTIADL